MPRADYISALPKPHALPSFPRRLSVIGSTGSIGTSALAVAAEHPDSFEIVALAGGRNITVLAEQAARFRPDYLCVLDEEFASRLAALLPAGYSPAILSGPEGYATLAALDEADVVLSSVVGAAGLHPTLAAVRAGKIVALANKEALVLAGELIRETCRESGAVILPVDSEHNALFQALAGHADHRLRRIILTASGGPFRGKDAAFLENVTPRQALAHPTWSMGAKISIDSATLMNKGLEVIEAYQLYGMEPGRIEVVVHPQSIVHSLVEYEDGSMLAHLGPPNMRIPIAYCLGWPERLALELTPLDLTKAGALTFEEPDLTTFPCLRLAFDALDPETGSQAARIALNAANEEAVSLFLDEAISFGAIPRLCEKAMHAVVAVPGSTLDLPAILDIDTKTRHKVREWAAAL
ncbi:MAG: 1-deoxy-D-xylulose-5-phosphate reductoisomerase [Oceanidesulfovibrio sp.]